MQLTIDQVIEEARHWPREKVARLVDGLALALQENADSSVETVWRQEIRQRVAELESGQIQPIPGEMVSGRIRKIVGH